MLKLVQSILSVFVLAVVAVVLAGFLTGCADEPEMVVVPVEPVEARQADMIVANDYEHLYSSGSGARSHPFACFD
jgi:type IV pilus biogenesis protein CpaD/CtpE